MHSQVSPEKEGQRFCSRIDQTSVPVLFGLGALHHIRALSAMESPPKQIILWEPLAEVWNEPNFQNSLGQIIDEFKHSEILLFSGQTLTEDSKQNIKRMLLSNETKISIEVLALPTYERYFPNLLQLAKDSISELFQKQNINQNTIQYFSKTWTQNYFKNLTSLTNTKKNIQWFQGFKTNSSTPIVFCGASPHLESEVSILLEQPKKFIIFASDTSVQYLLYRGIKPNYILSFDSGRGTLYHFLRNIPSDIPILTWLGGSSHLFESENPLILVNTGFPLDQILAFVWKKTNEWTEIRNPSLNLAGMIKSMLIQNQKAKLYLTGVSFISENGKSHCKGTGYELFYYPQVDRKKSLESFTKKLYSDKRMGKNSIAFDSVYQTMGNVDVFPLKGTSFKEQTMMEQSIFTFKGIPPKHTELKEWALQDDSGALQRTTINKWSMD
ncbi:DUF115 domain-containing protein [Leptospira sp. 96542]|nr:DUF115 domain-containing protein [Leptospira sp. 96542]